MPNPNPQIYTEHVGFRVKPHTKKRLGKLTKKEMKSVTDILRKNLLELLKTKQV